MQEFLEIMIVYGVGTLVGIYLTKTQSRAIIEHTVDELVSLGYLRQEKTPDGKIEIIKWDDNL